MLAVTPLVVGRESRVNQTRPRVLQNPARGVGDGFGLFCLAGRISRVFFEAASVRNVVQITPEKKVDHL
jgi:hypothetical protein